MRGMLQTRRSSDGEGWKGDWTQWECNGKRREWECNAIGQEGMVMELNGIEWNGLELN